VTANLMEISGTAYGRHRLETFQIGIVSTILLAEADALA
jgi:hypothetical protein